MTAPRSEAARQGEDRGRPPAHRRRWWLAPQRLRLHCVGGGGGVESWPGGCGTPGQCPRRDEERPSQCRITCRLQPSPLPRLLAMPPASIQPPSPGHRQRAAIAVHRRCLRRHRFRAERDGRAARERRAASASGEAAGRPGGEEVFGSEDNARDTRRADHEPRGLLGAARAREAPAVWLADRVQRYPDLWTGGAGTDAPRGIKDIVNSGHVDRISARRARNHSRAGRQWPYVPVVAATPKRTSAARLRTGPKTGEPIMGSEFSPKRFSRCRTKQTKK